MNLNGRLDRIEKQIEAAGIGLGETGPSMFNPSPEQQHEALAAIFETMPEEYARLVIADLQSSHELPDEIEWKPARLTECVEEFAWLRIYQCPRRRELPEEFCRAFERLEEPGDWLRWNWWECGTCHLVHPTVVFVPLMRGNFQRTQQLFDKCVSCGGQITVQPPPTQSPCHHSVGSPYRQAMAGMGGEA